MVEAVGGKAHLAVLEMTGNFVPMRFWQELGELRRARYEETRLAKDKKRTLIDEKKRKFREFIKEEKDGLQHAVNAVGFLYALIRNCAYDIHIIKSTLKEMLKEDRELRSRGFPTKIEQDLEREVWRTLHQINQKVREGSDIWGALTRE